MLCEFRLAEKDDTNAIVKLLNEVTLNLHERNIEQWTYPWEFKEIDIEVKNRNVYVVTIDKVIIGTFSLKHIDANSWISIIKTSSIYFYRIAILPEYQGQNIGLDIINYVSKISRDSNKYLYLDCWAGNQRLKKFYLKAGFDFCGDFPEDDYMISVFKH